MSQQLLTQYAPLVKVTDIKMIPVAAIGGQTRDGKDEIITGAGNMVFVPTIGDNGMWVPVSEENPLPIALSGQYVILSTDPKPELDSGDRAFLLEQDTGTIYYWNGSEWVEG